MIIDKNFSPLMEKIFTKKHFSKDETEAFAQAMFDGTLSDIRIAAILTAFRFIKVTEENVLTILRSLKSHNLPHTQPGFNNLVDCSRIGGEKNKNLNLSIAIAIVAAAGGAKVARFVDRNTSYKIVTSDMLSTLGIPSSSTLNSAYNDLKKYNITFIHSNNIYPNLKRLAHICKTLGFKTIVDLILPLSNPTPLTGQLVGVSDKNDLELMSQTLRTLGLKRAIIAFSNDGFDKLSVCGETTLAKLEGDSISNTTIQPSDFGFKIHNINELKAKDIDYNSKIIMDALRNDTHQAISDAVTLNAGALLWCAEQCDSLQECVTLAKEIISSKKAYKLLEQWLEDSKTSKPF